MKRGLIRWDRAELPVAAFEARLEAINRLCAEHDVPALVAYSDVCRSNDVRYVSNYMPYWNRALTVVPQKEKPILLCALSPRVYPWIRSVTLHETIVPSPSLPAQIQKLCAERSWTRLGIVDQEGLPSDLYAQLSALPLDYVDIPRQELRPAVTDAEIAMHRHGARLAREGLEAEVSKTAIGISDHELTGRLERRLRRAGIEDLVVLTSDGTLVPRPAAGKVVGEGTSVHVALEYNGHWVKLSRNIAGIASPLPPTGVALRRELLSAGYPWQEVTDPPTTQAVTALQVAIALGKHQLYYGDTGVETAGGWQAL